MIKHFNLDIFEKDSNKISEQNYMNLKFKNRDEEFIKEQRKRIKFNFELNMKYFNSLNKAEFNNYLENIMKDNHFKEINDLKKYMVFQEYMLWY